MKRIVNKLIREESGQALIIAVILMLVGGLIIAPLLGYMGTGLMVGQVFEEKMDGLYAADAGIEDALWKLLNGDSPACNLTDVNGMDVTVEQIGYEETAAGKLYTLQSTAYLAGETKAEIIAQVMVAGGSVEEGGEGGEYKQHEETRALGLIGENTMIFTTQNPSEFWGREDDQEEDGTEINPEDIGLLNMATGKAHLYLDGDLVMTNPKYKIIGVHYYQEGGSDYLLISVRDNDKVGTDTFNSNDIIRLGVEVAVNTDDPADPYPYISAVDSVETFNTLGAGVFALSRRDDTGIILFSMHGDTILGGTQFYKGEVIEFNPTDGTYTSVFNAYDIIPEPHPDLKIDCLAVLPAPDPRLLISFASDAEVIGSDGERMRCEDIDIWDPGDPGDPNDDTINLHIGMRGQLVPGTETTVSIISWEVSP